MSKTHHAYPEQPELEAVMRLQAVKRWHMIDTTRTQTLAEHTANVALLAWTIAFTSPGGFLHPSQALLSGILHDLGETFLGDVPTHSKGLIGKEAVAQAEALVTPRLFQTASKLSESSIQIKQLVKLCDLADGIRFIRLHGVDLTARHAQEGLEAQFADRMTEVYKQWPQVVVTHVYDKTVFYAYEQAHPGVGVQARFDEGVRRHLAEHVA